MLVDTHAHLNLKDYDEDREAVIFRAQEAGVGRILDVGTDLSSSLRALSTAEKEETVFASVGIHPHDAAAASESDFNDLNQLLNHPRVLALGEIGLDYHYDLSPRDRQRAVFVRQLRTARQQDLPVVIHVREAMTDALDILKSEGKKWQGVFHCFGGAIDDVPPILAMGFYISFTGVVTFRNFKRWDVVRSVPLDRLLLETDAPYMTPVPYRGRRNEPARLSDTADVLSRTLEIPRDQLDAATTENARQLFGMGL